MNASTSGNAISLLIAIVAVGYAVWSTSSASSSTLAAKALVQPNYYIPNQQRSQLKHVQDAFTRAGYQLVTNENYTEEWHTMWTFHNPFWQREKSVDLPAKMKQLKSNQKVNHLPGASYFTSKVELAAHTTNFSFVPKSFLVPEEYKEFTSYRNAHGGANWVRKGSSHRGVRIVDPADPKLAEESDEETIVQQFIMPYLVDKRMWDVGLYIAITSINPLRLYYFDNILVRACSEDFVEDLKQAPRDAYVVADDYLPPWGVPSFRPYYTWGMSTLNVVRAFFFAKGVMFDDVLKEMKANVLEIVGSFAETMEDASFKYPHGQKSFYSLYRVDFLLDRNLKPWITEINQSPNLSSEHFPDLATMFQRIAYSLLSLVGLVPGGIHHPSSSDIDLEILLHANDVDIGYTLCGKCSEDCSVSEKCMLCRPCRTSNQTMLLKELISEHRSRLGFIPLYPLRNSTFNDLKHLSVAGEDNRLLQDFVLMKCDQDYTWC